MHDKMFSSERHTGSIVPDHDQLARTERVLRAALDAISKQQAATAEKCCTPSVEWALYRTLLPWFVA